MVTTEDTEKKNFRFIKSSMNLALDLFSVFLLIFLTIL